MRRVVVLAFLACVACSKRSPQAQPSPAKESAPPAMLLSGAVDAAAKAEPVPEPEPAPAPRSLAGKKVLHVGDSMVGGTFGLTRAIERKLVPEGAKIVRHTTVSESINSFDKGPTLRDLLREHQPDIVIVTLGANDALSPFPEGYGTSVERIVKRIGDRECWWIGPPRLRTATTTSSGVRTDVALSKVIGEHAGKCRFYDSTSLELDRASDGLHPNDHGAAKWADAFWLEFNAPPKSP